MAGSPPQTAGPGFNGSRFRLEIVRGKLIFQYPPGFYPRLEAFFKENGFKLKEGEVLCTGKKMKYYSTDFDWSGRFRELLGFSRYDYRDAIEEPLFYLDELNLAFFRIVPDEDGKVVIPICYLEYDEAEKLSEQIAKALKRIMTLLSRKKIVITITAQEIDEGVE